MTVFAPSSADEVAVMLETALSLPGPSSIRFPKTPPPARCVGVGEGLRARQLREGDTSLCILGVGKLVGAALDAADILADEGVEATVFDVRVVSPPDPEMLATALAHRVVVTVEDGFRHGGAGDFVIEALLAAGRDAGVPLPSYRVLGVPRVFVAQGKPDALLAELGLDGAGIAESVRACARRRARAGIRRAARPAPVRAPPAALRSAGRVVRTVGRDERVDLPVRIERLAGVAPEPLEDVVADVALRHVVVVDVGDLELAAP